MRKSKEQIKKVFCTMVAIIMFIAYSQCGMLEVLAGSSDIVVDNSSFAEAIDATKWSAPNNDVVLDNGKIVFSKESTKDTRLITRRAAKATEYNEEFFKADYTIKLNELPQNESFIVAFSLANVESRHEEAGNMEIVFQNVNGIKVAVRAFDDNGKKVALVDGANCGISQGKTFSISVKATNDMKLAITVNNKTIYNDKSPVDLNGRMGFLQTGSCAVEIHKVNIVSHEYNRPENANIMEDFEQGSMDKNTLTSTMTRDLGFFPSGIFVEEYNGSKVLMFRNVSQGFFGTKYQYSNFEVSFDIPYVLRSDITDENGNIQAPSHGNLVLGIGDESDVYSNYGYQTSGEGLVFNPDSITSLKTPGVKADLAGKGYYDPTKNEGYSVKVTVVDTMITVYVKALTATKYDQVLNYKVGAATPDGYVHIWSSGKSNFAIDNFKIENKDKDGNVLDLKYEPATIQPEEDWEYKPMKVVYLDEITGSNQEPEEVFNWAMLLVYAGIAGVLIIAVCTSIAVISKHPKTKKKEVDAHES